MADVETARLCVQIIHSHFGPLTATIADVLLTRGRLPLAQIIRFAQLRPRIVRAAVLILVQHNILWHDQTDDEGEVLEINVEECLVRLRFGRFVWLAEELFGRAGGEIVQLILDHGKLRPPDIISQLASTEPKVLAEVLYKLVTGWYLKPSTAQSHMSPMDRRLRYEAEERAKISGYPTAKEIRQSKEKAHDRLKLEEEEAEKVGLTRRAKDRPSHIPAKRKGLDGEVVDDNIYFRVNLEKFNIHVRNKLIEGAARERFNSLAALVMQATLKCIEPKQKHITDVRSEPISISSIAMQIPDDVDLSTGLKFSSSKTLSTMGLVKEYIALLAASDNPTATGRAASFLSLTSSKVQVEYDIVGRRLRRRVLEAVAKERHGNEGLRIVRLLLDTGKIDEKQISKITMMAAKDIRPLLFALSTDSLVSIQEVPKSADRNPTRTFYLWYVDLQKAYSVLLCDFYKILHNIRLRRRAEEEEPPLKAVLDKRERSDVSQDESLLTRMERDVLKEWESKRERLTILEMRVEEAAFILSDFDTGFDDE